jgi:hypothetical protein
MLQHKHHKKADSNPMRKLQFTVNFKTLSKIKYLLVFVVAFCLSLQNAKAQVTVTPARGGGALCAGVYTTLGNIVITEVVKSDFAAGGAGLTLIITAPAYDFNPGVGTLAFGTKEEYFSRLFF